MGPELLETLMWHEHHLFHLIPAVPDMCFIKSHLFCLSCHLPKVIFNIVLTNHKDGDRPQRELHIPAAFPESFAMAIIPLYGMEMDSLDHGF